MAFDLHLIVQGPESESVHMTMNGEDRLRKWVFICLGLLFAAQLYFVRELFAALFLFAASFLAIAIFAGVIFLVHEGGTRLIAWAEVHCQPLVAGPRRALAYAVTLSKKPFLRPHSPPAP